MRRRSFFDRMDDEDFADERTSASESTISPAALQHEVCTSPGGGPGESGPEPPAVFTDTGLDILHANIRGFLLHRAELELHLEVLGWPAVVGLTETLLDRSVPSISLTGYALVARRDRQDDSGWGGIALFVRSDLRSGIAHLADSPLFERSWFLLHTDHGPFTLCLWYRPPRYNETNSITSFAEEWSVHSVSGIGTVVTGDLNVHHKEWLRFSRTTTPEGRALYDVCLRCGFNEKVGKPTRGSYLLDLVLTDMDCVTARVDALLSDHCMTIAQLKLNLPQSFTVVRECWIWSKARWHALNTALQNFNWGDILAGDADAAAENFTATVLSTAKEFIPCEMRTDFKSTHPWLNDRCRELLRRKRAAFGTPGFQTARDNCSAGMREEFFKFVDDTKKKLSELPKSSKRWWKLSNSLMLKAGKTSSIPPLKNHDGDWVTSSRDKAELFATTFWEKFNLPEHTLNEFDDISAGTEEIDSFLAVRTRAVRKVLKKLKEDSGTGPDALASRVLKHCSAALALPIAILARRILHSGIWPSFWKVHWIFPLFKKRSVYEPSNYRGIHLTAQVAKVVERVLGHPLQRFFEGTAAFGENQFAYTRARGYKDAMAFNTLNWIWALNLNQKVALYCSDVAGAFDKVRADRLIAKLEAKGVRGPLLQVIRSWLVGRRAFICVEGEMSEERALKDQVFQGTVWGPPLWNCFYQDAQVAVNSAGFTDTVFADDLNCFLVLDAKATVEDAEILMQQCQARLHRWGAANQVSFDPGKESFHILHRRDDWGPNFTNLGVTFDTKLRMNVACREIAQEARWRLNTLLRARRFHTCRELVKLYKTHILSYLESGTPAVYHAAPYNLHLIDHIQEVFLRELGISDEVALADFNLAPLNTRRDIAMLGLIHRTTLNLGPPQFKEWFVLNYAVQARVTRLQARRHSRQLIDPCDGSHTCFLQRSAFGLIKVYNLLPQAVVNCSSVKAFQHALQELVKAEAGAGNANWQCCLGTMCGGLFVA